MSVFVYVHLDALFTVVLFHKRDTDRRHDNHVMTSQLIGQCSVYNLFTSSSAEVFTLFHHVIYLQNDQVKMIDLIQSQTNCTETLCAPFLDPPPQFENLFFKRTSSGTLHKTVKKVKEDF
ncbi:hypothetical protein NL108_017944 [Boleophthalmus pectinirostris]|nr:hypothetical protein NL108_017944 [Boleophthalmus pectinirostris]